MDSLRAYILSVVGSSLICGCIQLLIGKKGATAALVRTLCGIYMAFVLIAPLQRLDFSIYEDYFAGIMKEADDAVTWGENMATHQQAEIIKRKTEAYILDKAVSLGADVTVEVTLSEDSPSIPIGITIKGAVSPYVKKVLKDYIKEQLGIPEGAQKWIQNAS